MAPFQRGGDYVSSSTLARIETYFRTLIAMDSSLREVKGTDRAASTAPTSPRPAASPPAKRHKDLVKADKKVDKGTKALAKKRWSAAARAFGDAVELYKKRVAYLHDFSALVNAQLMVAVANYQQGYEDDGDEALARALAWRPNLVVDNKWLDKTMSRSLARLRNKIAQIPTGTISVTCSAPGCSIYIDGELKGTGSASVTSLPRGHHFVRAVADGHTPWAERVFTPGAGKSRAVAAKLASAPGTKVAAPAPAPGGPTISPAELDAFAARGDYGSGYAAKAAQLCRQTGATHVAHGFVNRVGDQLVVAVFLFSPSVGQVAEVGKTTLALNLSDMQTQVLRVSEQVSKATKRFPGSLVVRGTPAIYARWERKSSPPAVVTAPPTKAPPAKTPPATAPKTTAKTTTPPVPVYKPQPTYQPGESPKPGVYQPTPTAKAPTPTPKPVYKPKPEDMPPPLPGFKVPPAKADPGTTTTTAPAAKSTSPVYKAPAAATAPTQLKRKSTPFTVAPRAPGFAGTTVTESAGEPWYKKWWVWTIVGVVVVGGVVTGVVLGTASDPSPPSGFTVNVNWE